jgi:penicillin-binding protein 1A
MGQTLTEGGYYMRTTLDPRLQTIARASLMQGLENYDHRHGWRGAFAATNLADGWEKAALTHVAPAERRAWRAAAIVSESPVRVKLAEGGEGEIEAADVAWARAGKGLRRGDLVWVEPSAPGLYHLRQIPQVNGALVAMDPYTGRVLAMVGGYSFSLSNFNRATQAMRQPGSSFKPFVYATALQNGYTPARVVDAGPVSFQGSRPGEVYSPHNYESESYGVLPIRRGLELSLNTMTVRIAQNVGMKKIVANAVKAGVVDHMDPVLAMALGAGETTPLRLTGAYSAFVNGGFKVQPHVIEMVQDREGKTVFDADKRPCTLCDTDYTGEDSPHLDNSGQEQVFDPITAYQINSMLQGVVQRGTASAASVIGRPLGGKTGTSQDFRSAWFFGFTPDMVVGVFVGFDDNRSLGDKETGAKDAVPIFIDFMQQALKDTPVHAFKVPADAKFAMVNGVREAFQPGTEPHEDVALPEPIVQSPDEAAPPGPPIPVRAPGPALAPPPPRPADDLHGLY